MGICILSFNNGEVPFLCLNIHQMALRPFNKRGKNFLLGFSARFVTRMQCVHIHDLKLNEALYNYLTARD